MINLCGGVRKRRICNNLHNIGNSNTVVGESSYPVYQTISIRSAIKKVLIDTSNCLVKIQTCKGCKIFS